jgi:hypothetical protein
MHLLLAEAQVVVLGVGAEGWGRLEARGWSRRRGGLLEGGELRVVGVEHVFLGARGAGALLLVLLVLGTVSLGPEAGADGGRGGGARREDGAGADGRGRLDLHEAGRVDDGGWVDGRHPDADLVLLENVDDEGVEVDVGFGVVEEGELVIVAETELADAYMRKGT